MLFSLEMRDMDTVLSLSPSLMLLFLLLLLLLYVSTSYFCAAFPPESVRSKTVSLSFVNFKFEFKISEVDVTSWVNDDEDDDDEDDGVFGK